MTNNDELLPCPFCMSSDVLVCKHPFMDFVWVNCYNCHARGPTVNDLSEIGQQKATVYWNKLNTYALARPETSSSEIESTRSQCH